MDEAQREIKQRIAGCIAIEEATALIYDRFATMFPDAKGLWEDLLMDERQHSESLTFGSTFEFFGEDEGQFLPPSMPMVKRTIDYAKGVAHRLEQGHFINLKEALDIALTLEQSSVEGFVEEIAPGIEGAIAEGLDAILKDEREHIDKIRSFMIKKGYSRTS